MFKHLSPPPLRAILLLLLLATLSQSLPARDFKYTYEGQTLTYTVVSEKDKTVQTREGDYYPTKPGHDVKGKLVIPSTVSDGKDTYTVTSIGRYGFTGLSLESVVIPNTVKYIGSGAFKSCYGFTSVTLPNSLTSIEHDAFRYSSLTSVTLPNSLTSIGDGAFRGTPLTSVTFPNSLISIGDGSFQDCRRLTSVTLPNSLIQIGEEAFKGCTGLTSMTIPVSVTYIDDFAFWECSLKPLIILSKGIGAKDIGEKRPLGLESDSEIVALQSVLEEIQAGCTKTPITPYDFVDYSKKLFDPSYSFKLERSKVYDKFFAGKNLIIELKDQNNNILSPDINGIYTITGFEYGKRYSVNLTWECDNEVPYGTYVLDFELSPAPEVEIETTQSTMTFSNFKATETETEKPIGYKLLWGWHNPNTYEYNGKPIKFTNMDSNKEYYYKIVVDYGVGSFTSEERKAKTESLSPSVTLVEKGPTSIAVKGSYTKGDAIVKRTYFNKLPDGDYLLETGLKPETKVSYTYYVETEHYYEYDTGSTYLPALELKTLQPRCVSDGCAIVAAETNISDLEVNVGFQWKKYDAPESLAPSEAYAAVYDGMLEGYIKNLQSTKYYNVRAFYKASDGTYYYSDWVTFDPSDFSYFEPTVHTYPVQTVADNQATVRGYALPGTDNIRRQGVQYWPDDDQQRVASGARAPSAANITTVEAKGQVMTVVLEGLAPDTRYVYRAFAETDNGFTYGEEMSFRTTNTSGVEAVVASPAEATVLGYYNLSGTCSTEPHKGFNIVLYSDGTTKKMIVR